MSETLSKQARQVALKNEGITERRTVIKVEKLNESFLRFCTNTSLDPDSETALDSFMTWYMSKNSFHAIERKMNDEGEIIEFAFIRRVKLVKRKK